jgi:hypothetical protein
MQKNAILLQELSIEQLQLLIGSSVKDGIQQFQKEIKSKENSEELLTRDQLCKFLHIDPSTAYAWCNAGKIKCYGIGARRYFRKSEIMQSLTLLKKK